MSNECQRVIMLHALTEICRIFLIEENIFISSQTLTYTGKGKIIVYFLPESLPRQIQATNFHYKLHLKQDQSRSHKTVVYPRTVTTLQHVLLLTENKKKLCAPV